MTADLAGERMPSAPAAVRVATPAAPAAPAGAAERILIVLEAALEHPRFSDVVAATGLPKATVHRLLATLVTQRFLATDPAGSYLPGPAILAIAGRALAGVDISAIAQPFVDDLVATVDCTVHIGYLAGDSIVYVMRSDSRKPYTMPSRVGHAAPLHTTGIGKVILASYPDDTVDRIIASAGLARITDASITDPDAFRREIAGVRSRGTARDRGENVPGIACIAAPLFDHTGTVRYGLSVSTLSIEHSDEQIEAMSGPLLKAAAAISQALGYQGSAFATTTLGNHS
ncbi:MULTISPECIES: IclR family transcriptional regulator [unclassified Cryobacterium]|uniref:IclR family transcriptional regulator n=2 Tax=Cryobacterium TaxID=69578 RepID=UPI002AB4C73B|nr:MULTISPECIES: IclR family transcriptional regulator [unclassified Cryobacterium]MDY7528671.1 IclR family transcriptional regulator [Cryobacterium sp. 10C2]MDY7555587.1 IclR family transcriptional regulator [Cryobacterium sp. 10C3]MEB0202933.1 IclR family transcriptional regulator [Cryobacterium sp. 5I3]MEB0287086.1 IclR family transcriptional regulator [Cryobacterium sp. 10S3]WPX12443.1 IclR family transcriptional regulator [Cryobacterium sp. 10S3]